MKWLAIILFVLTGVSRAGEEGTGAWSDIKSGTMKVIRGASKGVKKAASKIDEKIAENQKEDEAEERAEQERRKK